MSGEAHNPHLDAAPYVLGALSEAEHELFVEHLRTCAPCREEVAAMQAVARALPAAVPQLSAPATLRDRVMGTVRSEAELRTAGSRPRAAAPARAQRSRGWRWALPSFAGLAVAVLLAVLLVGGSSGPRARTIRAQAPAQASVTLRIAGGHGTLQISGMPRTAPGKVYEVWVKRAGGPLPTDALFTVSSAGDATVAVPGTMSGVRIVMVTAEPEGGSRVPTGAPVIVASLA